VFFIVSNVGFVIHVQEQDPKYYDWAEEDDSDVLEHFAKLAKELQVVLPISFFERKRNAFFNSIVVFDSDGTNLGKYRKSHIPDGPGYQEKFYFSPGDTGFRTFSTNYGVIGIGICWDQWFPETARALVLNGAEILFYPTAIGSEPKNPDYDSAAHWQRCMTGHAACNMVPVVASNRVGTETFTDSSITFYG
jgi:N-carbamoylputrescine amidase